MPRNTQKNETDWMDMNQLFYLADSSVYFLTDDERIRKRCDDSPQAVRIELLEEFLSREGLML